MKHVLMFVLFAAFAPVSAETLPNIVYFKSMTEGFSHEYLYVLRGGKIFIKPNSVNTGTGGDWKLFDGTGVPHGRDALSFTENEVVKQFSTEGTMIAALSSSGRFYLWQPTLKKNTRWIDKTGAPFEDALYLPPSRAWSFSMSVARASWKWLTPMPEKDIVSYWEDRDGNRTEFGFTATIYSVDPDGRTVRYTDTGLPVSWSKGFLSPENGSVVIENISSAASAVLVSDSKGNLFTRMIDYEMEGGCPALRFVYTRKKRTAEGETASLMESVRTLPLDGWRKQESIKEITGNSESAACVTRRITILLTGKGNSQREIRVQGRNADGEYGYWHKKIFDSVWEFRITGEIFSDSEIIRDYGDESELKESRLMNYSGEIEESGIKAELIGFHYYSDRSVLRIHAAERTFDINLYTVDLWSPVTQKKIQPELIGHSEGEPKLLQGTIDIPEDILNSGNAEIKEIIDRYFRNLNLVPMAFKISADDGAVVLSSKRIQRSLDDNMKYRLRKNVIIYFKNGNRGGSFSENGFYSSIANAPALTEAGILPEESANYRKRMSSLLNANRKALREMRILHLKFKKDNLRAGAVSVFGSAVYYLFDGIVNIIGLPYWYDITDDPGRREALAQLVGVSYSGGAALQENAKMNFIQMMRSHEDYDKAVKIFEDRIDRLGRAVKYLDGNKRK